MKKHLLIIILSAYSIISCHKNSFTDTQNYPITINISNAEIKDTLNLSQIAESIEYIPLQTTSDCLLSDINFFIVAKDFFFLKNGSTISKFNKTGEYKGDLFSVGNGPNETKCRSFTLDEENEVVYVLSNNYDIKKYSFDGEYLGDINSDLRSFSSTIYHIGYFNNNLFIPFSQRQTTESIYSRYSLLDDTTFSIYKNYHKYLETQKDLRGIAPYDYHFQIQDSGILYKECFCDTIFFLNSNFKDEPRYIIEPGNKKLTWEEWRDQIMFMGMSDFTPPTGYIIQSFVESKSFIFFLLRSYSIEPPTLFAVYNKSNGDTKLLSSRNVNNNFNIRLKNDINDFIDFNPINRFGYIFAYVDNCMYSIVPAYEIIDWYDSNPIVNSQNNNSIDRLGLQLDTLTENSNPVMIKISLK